MQRRVREKKGSQAFKLEDHVFFYFSQILARRTRAINACLRRYGLDYPRWRVLAVLQEHSGATMGRLADLTSVDRTTLTRTLGLMESAGLIDRREQKSDRRSLAISLTAQGRRLFARILPIFETRAPKYAWLNNVIAVGVYRGLAGKIAYRVYRIL